MANAHRGELAFDVEGKEYTLHFSANAICELEDKLDRSFLSISKDLAAASTDPTQIRMSTLRAIFWSGLRDHHPDIDLQIAGELMIKAGGLAKAMDMISEAFTRAFPAAETKAARPPKGVQRKNGTGLDS